MDDRPIGVFDSGVGGLSLLRELCSLLPNENFIYISDNAFAPYGALSPDDILERSQRLAIGSLNNHVNLSSWRVIPQQQMPSKRCVKPT